MLRAGSHALIDYTPTPVCRDKRVPTWCGIPVVALAHLLQLVVGEGVNEAHAIGELRLAIAIKLIISHPIANKVALPQ